MFWEAHNGKFVGKKNPKQLTTAKSLPMSMKKCPDLRPDMSTHRLSLVTQAVDSMSFNLSVGISLTRQHFWWFVCESSVREEYANLSMVCQLWLTGRCKLDWRCPNNQPRQRWSAQPVQLQYKLLLAGENKRLKGLGRKTVPHIIYIYIHDTSSSFCVKESVLHTRLKTVYEKSNLFSIL